MEKELIPHLFRTEFRKITTVLCKAFGFDHIEIAEDIASETFLSALETWPFKGIPENPVAWLYAVAKNKAKNYLNRRHILSGKIAPQLQQSQVQTEDVDIDLSEKNIQDSQLQMLFAVCHPSISTEAQIALSLRILCGFGIGEIANAFLTNTETINKRLFRAKEKLRLEKVRLEPIPMELTGEIEINTRLQTVLTTLYLLFNEGYYSESRDSVLREDLCLEAMRLTYLLLENTVTAQSNVHALFSLMCFHASRFETRKTENGEIILYHDQDETRWNSALIAKGAYHLHLASQGTKLSKYHIEAGIAYWHTRKEDSSEKWSAILQLYNHLLQLEYSPIAALNRTYALAKVNGKGEAIREAEKLNLASNHFYFMLLGELYIGVDSSKAKLHLEKAFALAKTQADKQVIQKKIDTL